MAAVSHMRPLHYEQLSHDEYSSWSGGIAFLRKSVWQTIRVVLELRQMQPPMKIQLYCSFLEYGKI